MSRRLVALTAAGVAAVATASTLGAAPSHANPRATTTTAPHTMPVYYVGSTPLGPRLYRDWQSTTAADVPLAAVRAAVDGTPTDHDYRTLWPTRASVRSVTATPDLITIRLRGLLHDAPAGMNATRAGLSIQQLVYTAEAAYGHGRVPVQILLNGRRSDTVLGSPTSEPLAAASPLATLSHVMLDQPREGQVVNGWLRISGVGNSFEGTITLRLQRHEGTYIAFQKPIQAAGWTRDRLYPFATAIDVSKVAPGLYDLMAMPDDPSGRGRFFSDTRTIRIR